MIGAVLAGGENRRIPVLKGFLNIEGRAIIERTLATLSAVFDKVVISTNIPERHFYLGVPLIGDIIKEKGPVIGMLSVLYATGEEAVFFVACDMPFVSGKLVRYMASVYERERPKIEGQRSKAKGQNSIDAVVPVFEGKTEPLFGIYTRNAVCTMETMVRTGKRGLIYMLDNMNVRYIGDEEVRAMDPEGRSFVNVNTIEDYERIGGKTCLV